MASKIITDDAQRTERAIAYRRVSTAGQVDRYGLDAQAADLRAYAARTPLRIVRTETDAGLSGTLPAAERPALLAALRAIRDGEARVLLLPTLDRLARQLTVQEAVLAEVWRSGGEVHAADAGVIPRDDPDDPMRTAVRQILGAIAQLDRAMAVRRMRNGRKVKRAQGRYAGDGSPRYGQRSVDGDLADDPAEAAAVAIMVQLHVSGMSLRQIVAELDRQGIVSKRGGRWHPNTVRRVISRASGDPGAV